jgi:hypothetical protein
MPKDLRTLIQERAIEIDVPPGDIERIVAAGRTLAIRRRIGIVSGLLVTAMAVTLAAQAIDVDTSRESLPSAPPEKNDRDLKENVLLRVESSSRGFTMQIMVRPARGELCVVGSPKWAEVVEISDQDGSTIRLTEPTGKELERNGVRVGCHVGIQPGLLQSLAVAPDDHTVVLSDHSSSRSLTGSLYLFADSSEPSEQPFRSATEALNSGNLETAIGIARSALRSASDPEHWNYGNAVHYGNLILGHVALRDRDVQEAGRYLLKAARTPGSPQLNSFGPNMSLARDLLRMDKENVVLRYLDLCRGFWDGHEETLRSWAADIRVGDMPDFGANLLYGGLNPHPVAPP